LTKEKLGNFLEEEEILANEMLSMEICWLIAPGAN
jgi:hypothetical protein